MTQLSKGAKVRGKRSDGRHQMLVYLRPEIIHQIKVLAAMEQRHAYEIIEDVLGAYLAGKRGLPK